MEWMIDFISAPIEAVDKFRANKHVKNTILSAAVAWSVAMIFTGSGSATEVVAGFGGTVGLIVSIYRDSKTKVDPNNMHCAMDDWMQ
jgi:hypothetical protein